MIFRKIGFLLFLLVIFGCSTKKNTWLSRNYHNLTAYYNVYYNGRDALDNGVKSIQKSYENDYSNILPLFESSDPNAIGVAMGDMDRAIEKGTKLIKKHSMTAKPKKRSGSKNSRSADFYSKKEYNLWVDNAYMLIGKAQFYKHEFLPAIRTFQYVIREFNNTPAQYEGLIWLARAYTEYQDYIGALSALESYDLGGNAPVELYGEFMAVYANLLLKQGKNVDAIPYLANSINSAKKRHRRIRFSYIIGQLYVDSNQKEKAIEAFAYVAKASPDYEMTFNAKVNRASIIYADADIEEVKKQLNKLRKDKKNKDFLDRIYWAFGQVAEQEGKDDEALSYYKKSVASSVSNDDQKGLSYRDAGEIYYDRFDYPNAFFHYDSALTVITDEYEKYDELVERHSGLSGLVENMLIVEREDSLQRLADMSEPVLLAYLDGIIELKKEEQRLAQERAEEDNFNDPFFYQNSSSSTMGQQAGGKWYFYNPGSMSMGKMEFEKRWGRRKLEDNWRRSDKSKNFDEDPDSDDPFGMPDDPFATDGAGEGGSNEDKQAKDESSSTIAPGEIPTREQLLADIPQTEEQRQASNERTEASLMEMGLLFMDRLANYPKSIESLEDLLSRYPEGEMRDQALVALYNAYRLYGNQAGMDSARRRLEAEFPDSRFVAYLNDPEFFDKLDQVRKDREAEYQLTYENFLFGRFGQVVNESTKAITIDEDNPLIPKYYLLRALSEGKQGNVELFRSDLDTLIAQMPSSEEAAMAKALLQHLEDGKTPVQGTLFSASPSLPGQSISRDPQDEDGESPDDVLDFVYVEKEPYELVVIGIEQSHMNRAIYNVADYNFSRYLLHDFEIKEQKLITGEPSIVVSGFKNKGEVMDYFYSLRERPEFFNFDFFKDNIVVISESNKNKFYLSGLVSEYKTFFNTYYLSAVDKAELEKVKKKVEEPLEEVTEDTTVVAGTQVPLETVVIPETIQQEEVVAPEATETKAEIVEQKEIEAEPETPEEIKPEQTEEVAVAPVEEAPVEEAPKPLYNYEASAPHSALIVVVKTRMDYNRLLTVYTNYTRNGYGSDLKVKLEDIGEEYRAIQVDGFKNADEAKAYIEKVRTTQFLTRDIIRKKHFIWVISEENLNVLTKDGKFIEYDTFFKSNY